MTTHSPLARQLGLSDAVFIGLGSMIGAGIFAAFTPAARAAGSGLLIGLVLAAVVAYSNALASAQLAVVYPTSGGTYVYGRRQLGPWWGFMAGWSFVIGKIASCAAMSLTFAAYVAPVGYERPVAVAAVVGLTAVNYRGVTRTASLTKIVVVVVLLVLALVVASASNGLPHGDWMNTGNLVAHNWYGIFQSAGLLFFAFAGYARIATMGEEVRNPTRTIPRAITISLALTVLIYGIIAVVVLGTLGSDEVAKSTAPLSATVRASGWIWAIPIVRIGAAAACLGALLALIAGVGRTSLAMAREGDLPSWFSAVHPRFKVPHHAEAALAVIVSVLVMAVDLRGAIGFSSFGVLLYYFIANVAAFTQPREVRRYPKALQVFGAIACLVLVATLPTRAISIGVGVLIIGVAYRLNAQRRIRGQAA